MNPNESTLFPSSMLSTSTLKVHTRALESDDPSDLEMKRRRIDSPVLDTRGVLSLSMTTSPTGSLQENLHNQKLELAKLTERVSTLF
jgi:hypothetical protein